MNYLLKILALLLVSLLAFALPTAALAAPKDKVKNDKTTSAPAVPDDNDDNEHPSGKDKETNNGPTDDTQGKSPSEPDQNGSGPERDHEGTDKPGGPGGEDKEDQDGNNGCGNDDDFEDDNEGNCGGKPKPTKSAKPVTPKPTKSAKPSESPKVEPSKSPKPVETVSPESPAPVVVTPTVPPTVKPPVLCDSPFKRIRCANKPTPTETPVAPVVPEQPKVGPVVPVKIVSQSSDTATATMMELPTTGANQTLMMLYVAMMLLGLGVLCYTLPVALTRVP